MKIPNNLYVRVMLLCGAIFISACSSPTKIVKRWASEELQPAKESNEKIIIFAFVKSEPDREKTEDLFHKADTNIVQSLKIFSQEYLSSMNNDIKDYLVKEGYKKAITMRLVRKSQASEWIPSNYLNSYESYHNNYMMDYYNPGYYLTGNEYYIETNLFSIADGRLLWSVTTKTPETLTRDEFIDEMGGAVIKQMRKDGLLN